MTRMDRRALFASGAAAALLAATGLSAAPKPGGRLRAALSGAARSDRWDAPAPGLFMQAAQRAVFENLTEVAPDGTLRGELATAWSTPDGGRTWDFDLRGDVHFHDDIALRAEDAVASLAFDTVASAPTQIRITLPEPDSSLPIKLAAPDHIIRPASAARAERGIGTGPYRVSKFEAGRHFIADRVHDHWKAGQAGWFDRIEFAHFADAQVRAEALATGLVDVADVHTFDGPAAIFRKLPNDAQVEQVVSADIAMPSVVGAGPLDTLRFSQRWWRA